MKKLVFSLFLGSVLVFGVACGAPDDSHIVDEGERLTRVGVLSEKSPDSDLKGSHIIFPDEGSELAVRSLSINLSSKKYLGNKLEIMGVMNDSDKVFEIDGITVLEILSDESVLGEFVEYKNSELGFRLKYYDDWALEQYGAVVQLTAPADDPENASVVGIQQIAYDYEPKVLEDGSTDTPLSAYFLETTGEDVSALTVKVGVDGVDAVKVDSGDGFVDYTLYRSGFVYKIVFTPGVEPDLDRNRKIFGEMMAEFRFLGFAVESDGDGVVAAVDAGEVTNEMKVPEMDANLNYFESLPFSFRAAYPSDWYYKGKKPSGSGIFHHYGFSTESVTDENEILSLEVIDASLMKAGNKQTINGRELDVVEVGGILAVYVKVEDIAYRVQGPVGYRDALLKMASNISHIETGDE